MAHLKHIHLVLDLNSGEITGLALPRDAGATPGAGNSVFGWGAGTLGSSTSTRFLYAWFDDGLAETNESGFRAPRAGTLKNLHVRHKDPKGNGNNIVYTLRVAGVDSTVIVTLPSTSLIGSDLVNSIAVSAGDLVSVKVTKALGIGQSPRNVTVSAEFE